MIRGRLAAAAGSGAACTRAVARSAAEELAALSGLSPDQLRKARADRFYAIGRAG